MSSPDIQLVLKGNADEADLVLPFELTMCPTKLKLLSTTSLCAFGSVIESAFKVMYKISITTYGINALTIWASTLVPYTTKGQNELNLKPREFNADILQVDIGLEDIFIKNTQTNSDYRHPHLAAEYILSTGRAKSFIIDRINALDLYTLNKLGLVKTADEGYPHQELDAWNKYNPV